MALYAHYGFAAIAVATILFPLGTLLLVLSLRSVAPQSHTPASFTKVARAVWQPGIGLALSGVGFGTITTFIVLLYAERGWSPAWLAFTALSVAFIAGRLVFSHLPDKIGGAKVAIVCVLIEAVAQALIWLAPWSWLALTGVILTGLGYSFWRGSAPQCAAAESWPRDGRIHSFPGSLIGICQSSARAGRELAGIERSFPRQHAGCAQLGLYRNAAHTNPLPL